MSEVQIVRQDDLTDHLYAVLLSVPLGYEYKSTKQFDQAIVVDNDGSVISVGGPIVRVVLQKKEVENV